VGPRGWASERGVSSLRTRREARFGVLDCGLVAA
jgi:hypothetical protein